MGGLSAQELVWLWEGARECSHPQRALWLLQVARQELTGDEPPLLSIGRRDAALLELRRRTFGRVISCVESCPECGRQSEIELDTDSLLAAAPSGPSTGLQAHIEGWSLQFRLPNTLDQQAVLSEQDLETAKRTILERCCLSVSHDGESRHFQALPSHLLETLEQEMASADPLADIHFALHCEDCGHSWSASLDVVSLLWEECAVAAQRLLREVHLLALAYHWPERDILAMTPVRRRFYLDCIES